MHTYRTNIQRLTPLSKILVLIVILFSFQACATHTRQIVIGALVGGAVGAGVGYTVVHHGDHRQYVVQNTIITSAVFSLLTAGALAWHYESLDQQKVEITSKFSRDWVLAHENNQNNPNPQVDITSIVNDYSPQADAIGKFSLKLDDGTRWVYPTFRKRLLKPEASENEILSSRFTWEIVRPGFFVTREQEPTYFSDDPSTGEIPSNSKSTKHSKETK